MDQCRRDHATVVIAQVAKQPLHDKSKLVMPRCAACAYEEGFVAGVEIAARNMTQLSEQLREQHDVMDTGAPDAKAA